MEDLKQILKWGAWSMLGLIALPFAISAIQALVFKLRFLPYIGIGYLLILLAVITLIIICVVGIQKQLNQDKTFELQQKALDDKYRKEQARIDVRLALEKEERDRKWKIEDEDRERKWKLEDEDRANAKTTTK